MQYETTLTTQIINQNTIVYPDGFSSFTFYNQTNTPITINNIIITPGQVYNYQLQPYQTLRSPLLIQLVDTPNTTRTGNIYLVKEYNKPI